jgi:hypothetical protein
MSNPATHDDTAAARTSSIHHGWLHCPAMARYPPTGAMDRLTPRTKCDHRVKRLV